ncbi:MAG: extensin family protein [Porphyrobacter sp.]|nr:extensin family protein [Porphyrobacter sp.]
MEGRPSHRFDADRVIVGLLIAAALVLAGRVWLAENPQANPWAPLSLDDPPGWATRRKLAALREDPAECRAVLERSGIAFRALDPAGEGACRREDRTVLADAPFSPGQPVATCAIAAGTELWLRQGVQPAARERLGADVARIEHLGTFSCRRIGGGTTGRWSEHATGNAIDIAAFVLEDGRRISVLRDWHGEGEEGEGEASDEAAFLRAVRDAACGTFGTVLSPDYNAAHADHFHLDQEARGLGGVCR